MDYRALAVHAAGIQILFGERRDDGDIRFQYLVLASGGIFCRTGRNQAAVEPLVARGRRTVLPFVSGGDDRSLPLWPKDAIPSNRLCLADFYWREHMEHIPSAGSRILPNAHSSVGTDDGRIIGVRPFARGAKSPGRGMCRYHRLGHDPLGGFLFLFQNPFSGSQRGDTMYGHGVADLFGRNGSNDDWPRAWHQTASVHRPDFLFVVFVPLAAVRIRAILLDRASAGLCNRGHFDRGWCCGRTLVEIYRAALSYAARSDCTP